VQAKLAMLPVYSEVPTPIPWNIKRAVLTNWSAAAAAPFGIAGLVKSSRAPSGALSGGRAKHGLRPQAAGRFGAAFREHRTKLRNYSNATLDYNKRYAEMQRVLAARMAVGANTALNFPPRPTRPRWRVLPTHETMHRLIKEGEHKFKKFQMSTRLKRDTFY
jgi:hypothetical protein